MKTSDFCTMCHYYLYLEEREVPIDAVAVAAAAAGKADPKQVPKTTTMLYRVCRNCGWEEEAKSGAVLEIDLKEKTSEGYKILLNEFTVHDPTLPHVNTITCPNEDCPSQQNGDKDVIYIKYDAVNLKFLYICTKCNTQWKSKS